MHRQRVLAGLKRQLFPAQADVVHAVTELLIDRDEPSAGLAAGDPSAAAAATGSTTRTEASTTTTTRPRVAAATTVLRQKQRITGDISPKSVVASPLGLVLALRERHHRVGIAPRAPVA